MKVITLRPSVAAWVVWMLLLGWFALQGILWWVRQRWEDAVFYIVLLTPVYILVLEFLDLKFDLGGIESTRKKHLQKRKSQAATDQPPKPSEAVGKIATSGFIAIVFFTVIRMYFELKGKNLGWSHERVLLASAVVLCGAFLLDLLQILITRVRRQPWMTERGREFLNWLRSIFQEVSTVALPLALVLFLLFLPSPFWAFFVNLSFGIALYFYYFATRR